jgi:hypothetical protein
MLADGAIESIDDIGDVQTAGTGHTPSDGDALVWNDSHSHWMPGEVVTTNSAGGNGIARAVFHKSFPTDLPSFNIASSVYVGTATGQRTVTFTNPISNPVVIIPDFQISGTSSTRITTYNNGPSFTLQQNSSGDCTGIVFGAWSGPVWFVVF